MRKVKVLFLAADPSLGRPGGVPLQLDEELRQIRKQVRQARYAQRLVLEPHGAVRAEDLMNFLEHTDAQVVHFSGHGGNEGLVLVGRGGHSRHPVDAAVLKKLFHTYHGTVRLVVLSACSSQAEAQAIADVVGCAIGTSSVISDDAAITFNGRFYRSIANGHSVQRAFDDACLALDVYRMPKHEYPVLVVRKGVDPAGLVLVKTYRPVPRRLLAAGTACVMMAAIINWPEDVYPELTASDIACGTESTTQGLQPLAASTQGAASTTAAEPAGAAAALANAKAFYRVRNYAAAASAFGQAAEDGNGEAMGCLGYMYLFGRGMDPKPDVGYRWVHQAATKERDPHGMYALAIAYLTGTGTMAREHLAKDWFEKSANLGYAEAMRSLGDLYRQKMNPSGYDTALFWFKKAVDAGSLDARVDLGLMYEFGWGVPRDPATALKWYQSAAAGGSARGMWAVGQSYQKGAGVARDYRQAMKWYRKAADAGSADAMNSIGVLYENGLGARKSQGKAYRWYKRAENAGSQLAKGNLGKFADN